MYSMVLAMALSGGAATPADHHGCASACGGMAYSGCYGGHGCWGSSCHGGGGHRLFGGHGCGGGGHKLFGGLFNRGGHGCSSSCHGGYACNGGGCSSSCHGGGHKLFGGLFNRGGHGCSSSCHGGYACNGGGCHGGHGAYHGCAGSHGCAGGHGCGGGVIYQQGAPTGTKPMPAAEPVGKPQKSGEEEARLIKTATLVVSLPADARLTIDNNPTTSTSTTRVFVTPELDNGTDYQYSLKAEVVRDGQTVTASKLVTVRAGEQTRVSLDLPEAVASR